MKPVFLSAALAMSVMFASGTAQGVEPADPQSLVLALQQGGLVIYIRHAATEKDYADQLTADPLSCATQRVLSERGWHQAKDLGQAIADLDIPVGEVASSQYCRAWQTADLAFGRYAKTKALNFEAAEEYTPDQIAAMRQRVLPILMAPIPQGENRVVVGHDDPFEAVTGIYPEPQGVAFILRPTADGVEVLGSIAPDQWPAP